MASTTMIPMLSPNGQSGEIPMDKMQDAQAAGFKVAVEMQAPGGQSGYIPADRVHDAAANGFKMIPSKAPDAVKASYWDALTNPVGSGGAQQGIVGGAQQVGGQAIKSMVQPVAHPLDTLEGIGNMVMHPVDTAKGIVQNFQNDVKQGGYPLALENAAGQVLGTAEGGRAMAAAAAPAASLAVKGAGRALLAGETPEAAYETALKPPPAKYSQPQRSAMVQTALQNSIPVSKPGLEKLGDLIDDLNNKIAGEVGSDPNRPIDTAKVAGYVDQAKARFANQVTAQPDLNAIEATRQQFLAERGAKPGTPAVPPQPIGLYDANGQQIMGPGSPANPPTPPQPIGAADAQAMKQGTYRVLRGKYGEQGSATVEAQKALARGLKDQIADAFPELKGMNAAESKLLDLQPVLERAVNRISNHQPIGIGTPILAGGVKAATGSTGIGAAAALYKAVVDNPVIKSRLAIAVSKGGKIPLAQAMARVSAYSTSLGGAVAAQRGYSSDASPSQSPTQ
jgi:hypothetical protein